METAPPRCCVRQHPWQQSRDRGKRDELVGEHVGRRFVNFLLALTHFLCMMRNAHNGFKAHDRNSHWHSAHATPFRLTHQTGCP